MQEILQEQQFKNIQKENWLYSPEWWTHHTIKFSQSRDILSLKILERIFFDYPYSLPSLFKELRSINKSKTSIWYRCKKLEELGFVKILRGNPIFVFPKDDLSRENMKRMLLLCYGHLQLKSVFI